MEEHITTWTGLNLYKLNHSIARAGLNAGSGSFKKKGKKMTFEQGEQVIELLTDLQTYIQDYHIPYSAELFNNLFFLGILLTASVLILVITTVLRKG